MYIQHRVWVWVWVLGTIIQDGFELRVELVGMGETSRIETGEVESSKVAGYLCKQGNKVKKKGTYESMIYLC